MRIHPDLQLPLALGLVWAALLGSVSVIADALAPPPAGDMADVRALFEAHGLPQDGFDTPIDLTPIDAEAPPECLAVARKAYIAKVAVERLGRIDAGDARGIAHAVARITADDAGTPWCLP